MLSRIYIVVNKLSKLFVVASDEPVHGAFRNKVAFLKHFPQA